MDQGLLEVAERALQLVPDGSRIGLGTGHAAMAFVRALGKRVSQGFRVRGVPTSEATAVLAKSLNIPLDTLDIDQPLELTVDGADEVEEKTLYLIKGWGGALLRERVVAAASKRQVILITQEKLVPRIGTRGKLPIEVLPFAEPLCRRRIRQLPFGLEPVIREERGRPYVTDSGHWILDCALQPVSDPFALDRALRSIPGVMDIGLFLGTASLVLVADGNVVTEMKRT
ncbi:MAG TPA: ribose-5-phosphate isomerase RpiA [Gemmataceae bacterium]|jgi:ribose 5-phosphate isomerase A